MKDYIRSKYELLINQSNYPLGISDAKFREYIIDYLLGADWYVVDPIGQTQVNEIALNEILNKYCK